MSPNEEGYCSNVDYVDQNEKGVKTKQRQHVHVYPH